MASANVKTPYGPVSRRGLGDLKYLFNCWGVLEIGDAIDAPPQLSRGKQNIDDLYAMAKLLIDDDGLRRPMEQEFLLRNRAFPDLALDQ